MIFTCATDDFQKSLKMYFLKIALKICRLKKIKCLMFFKVARPVCSRLHFDLGKHFTQKTFIFKNVVFCILYQKRGSKRFFFKHHQTVVHINAQIWAKNQFSIISALSDQSRTNGPINAHLTIANNKKQEALL